MTIVGSIKAVTFDFWNTLVAETSDPWTWKSDALKAALDDAKIERSDADIHAALAVGQRFYLESWQAGVVFTPAEWVRSVCEAMQVDSSDIADEMVDIVNAGMPAELRTIAPNIAETLSALRSAGLPIGIICDVGLTPSTQLRRYLEHFGLLAYFTHFSFSDEVGVFKPDPQIFHHAAQGLGVEITEILHTGDLRRTDIAGGRAVGATTARFAGIFDDADGDGPEGHHVTTDHLQLLDIIGI